MLARQLLLTSGVILLSGCNSEPRVFSELVARNEHFIYPDVYPPQTAQEFRDSVDLTASMVTLPFVLTAALRNEEVGQLQFVRDQESPEDWLREQLQVTTTSFSNSALIRIAIGNDVPAADATTIVNAVTDAFQREVFERERQEKRTRLEELGASIRKEQSELSRLQQELRRRDKEVAAANKEQADLKFEMLNGIALELRKNLVKLEWEILSGEIALEQLESDAQANKEQSPPLAGDQDAITKSKDDDSRVVAARASLARQEQMRSRIKQELEARQLEVRDLGGLWVDRELQADQVAKQKARVAQLDALYHKREVELQYQESHPHLKLIRRATSRGSVPDSTPYTARRQANARYQWRVAAGYSGTGAAVGTCFGILVGIALGRRRKVGSTDT